MGWNQVVPQNSIYPEYSVPTRPADSAGPRRTRLSLANQLCHRALSLSPRTLSLSRRRRRRLARPAARGQTAAAHSSGGGSRGRGEGGQAAGGEGHARRPARGPATAASSRGQDGAAHCSWPVLLPSQAAAARRGGHGGRQARTELAWI